MEWLRFTTKSPTVDKNASITEKKKFLSPIFYLTNFIKKILTDIT